MANEKNNILKIVAEATKYFDAPQHSKVEAFKKFDNASGTLLDEIKARIHEFELLKYPIDLYTAKRIKFNVDGQEFKAIYIKLIKNTDDIHENLHTKDHLNYMDNMSFALRNLSIASGILNAVTTPGFCSNREKVEEILTNFVNDVLA